MNDRLVIGGNSTIDLAKLIDTRLLVQANSGGGKSWLLRRLLEQSHGQVQQIIIDLEGEFSTLREQYDYILAGKDGDTPAEPRSAALLAKRLLELNVSAIIDLYELSHQDRKRFVRLFLSAMVNAPKSLWHPCIVVIDEAHVFAPQTGSSEAMEAVIDLATRGRKRGYCAILATQRISKLHKDAVAEMNNKLIGRTGLDIDRKRAAEELGFTTKEDSLSLRTLAPGHFYAFGAAISDAVVEVTVGDVKTSHPKAGDRILTNTTPPTEKIKSILGKLADLPQEARQEAQTIEEMRTTIAELERQNKKLSKDRPVEIKEKVITKTVKVSNPVDLAKSKSISNKLKLINAATSEIEKILGNETPVFSIAKPHSRELPASTEEVGQAKVTGGAERMLKVLAGRYPMTFTKSQLALLANMSPRSGTYGTYMSLLRRNGFIAESNGQISLTDDGLDYLGADKPEPQSQQEILSMWENNLTGGARRMFSHLIAEYPQSVSKEELGEATEMSSRSGTFGTYLSLLKRNGLIEVDMSSVRANRNLFVGETTW